MIKVMPDKIVPPSPQKRRRWLRWLACSAVAFLALIVAAYFIATSSAFLKAMILPRVSASLNATVTVSDASIHPFSELTLRDLKIQATGQEPLVTVSEVHVSYHLFDLLGGNIHVNEIALVSPTVELVENPDGTSNLDPILKALQSKQAPAKPSPSPKTSKPVQIDLGKLTLSDATILQIKNGAEGHRDVSALTNLNLTLTNLKNGQTAKLDLAADVQIENNSATNNSGVLAASLKANFDCSFNPDLTPGSASGGVNFAVSQAGGAFSDFDAFGAILDCDVTPTEVKQLKLHFQKAATPLGELAVTGPFDAGKMEGKLDVELRGVDRRLLNLVGEKSGLDFGTTQIDSTNDIELMKGGAAITVTGRFAADNFQLTRSGQTTPTLGFSAAYDVTLDRAAQSATLRSLNLAGTQNAAPLLSAQLTSPMNLAWGGGTSGMGDAAFDLTVSGLNLADWKPFIGDSVSTGNIGMKLKVSSHQGGKQIGFDLNADAANLTARLGSNQISQAEIILDAHGQASEFKQIALSDYKAQIVLQNQPAVTASGSGNYDLTTGDADTQVKLSVTLARLLQTFPQPDMNISSGDVELNARVTQKQKTQTVAGDLSLTNFNGQIGKNNFSGYSGQIKLDAVNSPEEIQIKQMAGSFSANGNSGGDFDLSGTYKPAQKSADVNVKLSSLNENTLRPFLEPLLAGKKLVSASLNGDVSGQYNPQSGSAVKANVQVANLLVNDPEKKVPATPLAVGLQVDASLNQQTADVRQLQIALTPTTLASNQLQFSGQVDFSNSKAIKGSLKLAADSLDLTSYYDLFNGGTNATAKPTVAAEAPPARAQQEPPAVNLPLKNFSLAADIGKLYLHELAISGFTTTVNIDGSHVVVKPCQLSLNGAPVTATADLDLGMPGYKYSVALNAQKVPLAPLVDTFQPARAGQLGGTVTTDTQISGAGITGASLQKNLAGKFSLDAANLNLSVANVQNKVLKGVVSAVATIPEILNGNPVNGVISLLGGVTGRGGLMNELQQSPIEVISARATVGNGLVNLQTSTVQSAAFEANATGSITLNSVLTNSTINIPVKISLSQAITSKLNLAAGASSPKTAYVPLPQFLTMTGTLGNPKTEINKLALVGLTLQSIPAGNNGSSVGNLLNQLLKPGK